MANELPEASPREAELQRKLDGIQSQEKLNEHSKQLEQSAEKLSQLESENLNLQGENQALNTASNKKRRFRAQIHPMPTLETPKSGTGGAVPGTGPGVLRSGEPGCLLAGTQRSVSCLGLPLIARFCHRTWGITCALKSTGVAHSQQASLRQDTAPVILRSRVPLRPEPYSEPGGGPMEKLLACDGILETAEPGDLMFPEEELKGLMRGSRLGDWRESQTSWLVRFLRLSYCRDILDRNYQNHLSASSVPTAGDRARLKRRMDFPVSRSESSSEPGEGSDCDLMAPLPLSCAYAAPPLVGPSSSVGEDDLREWRNRYSLPSSVVLRVPTPEERASSNIPGEIAVYEAFFDSGLRGMIHALIRILIAIQNLGDLEYLSLRIDEVLLAYHLAPLNGGEGRFHLRPRSGLLIMEELPKSDRKGPVFNKKWQKRYAFMMFPGSSYRWNFIAGTHPAPAEGERVVLRARQLLVDRRQVNFLVSETVLQRSSLWSKSPLALSSFFLCLTIVSIQEICVTNDPFTAYQEAAKVMSVKKGSSSRSASGNEVMITGNEVMITGSRCSTVVKLEPSPSLPGKKPKSGGVTTRSAQQSADMACSAGSLAAALSNLNLNVFPQDRTVLPIGDPSEVTVSQLYHLGERLSGENSLFLREEIEGLKRQLSGEKDQRAALELEIRDFKDKVKDLEKAAEASSADALATVQKNQELEEEIDALKAAAKTFKFEMVVAVNRARVVARWELMREWLRKQSAHWDLVTALEQYKAVVQEESRNKGVPPPTFEDESAIPPVFEMDVDSSVKPRGSPT
ncbi:LOW QUALITY PROTEIN: hypothetical protein HID58_042822 [Brassica napus]|uniref:Uncharacterized protein n=1 Tax=Brassica napus TaxID=3708 RepID=A0ABQ8BEQ9_BRANA|nr:LOW QUALITY PROTEIN: hypothetical protein HID58_042822 [Brassica napus]